MQQPNYQRLDVSPPRTEAEMLQRAHDFRVLMQQRRSVRHFDSRPVPRAIIEECLLTAGSAPSGANRQPWHFVAVSDWRMKFEIRKGVERAEHEFYGGAAPKEWIEAVAPLGTSPEKPYIEKAPWLICVFAQLWSPGPKGEKVKHYYVAESVGIACGMLVTALHNAGLATLTHTPMPMAFLSDLLKRPESERPVMIVVTGYPAPDVKVPTITKKRIEGYVQFIEGEER